MIDMVALDTECQTRAKTVPEVVDADSSENLDEAALDTLARLPFVYTHFSKEVATSERVVHNSKAQHIDLILALGLVTESVKSKSASVKKAKVIAQKLKALFHWWKPTTPGVMRPFTFVGLEYVGRKGSKHMTEISFATRLYETYT